MIFDFRKSFSFNDFSLSSLNTEHSYRISMHTENGGNQPTNQPTQRNIGYRGESLSLSLWLIFSVSFSFFLVSDKWLDVLPDMVRIHIHSEWFTLFGLIWFGWLVWFSFLFSHWFPLTESLARVSFYFCKLSSSTLSDSSNQYFFEKVCFILFCLSFWKCWWYDRKRVTFKKQNPKWLIDLIWSGICWFDRMRIKQTIFRWEKPKLIDNNDAIHLKQTNNVYHLIFCLFVCLFVSVDFAKHASRWNRKN